jgi:hypothetical protein
MKNQTNGWLTQGLLTAMALGGLVLGTVVSSGAAQNNSSNGNGRPFDTPPGKSDDGPGNSEENKDKEKDKGSKGGNGKTSSKDVLAVIANNATGPAGTITPILPDDDAANWRYIACLPNATSINQTFPIQFKLTNENDHAGDSIEIELDPSGRLSDKVSVPAKFPLLDNGVAALKSLVVTADDLTDGAYTLNIHVRATPQRGVEVTQKMVHIHIMVGSACGGEQNETSETRPPSNPNSQQPPSGGTLVTTVPSPAGTGFFTDGDFNLLENCAGGDVDGNTGGTFAIAARPQSNLISSSNPGTFYLNWIVDNTGAERNLTIELSAVNLISRGANAVHALQFDASGNIKNEDNFDMVNEDGKACGPDGPCTVRVGAGKKLWVNWHLTFGGKGQSAQGINSTCGQGLPISASATLKDGATQVSTTTVNARGYLK